MKLKKNVASTLLFLLILYAFYMVMDEGPIVAIPQVEGEEKSSFEMENYIQEKSNLLKGSKPKRIENKQDHDRNREQNYPERIENNSQTNIIRGNNYPQDPQHSEENNDLKKDDAKVKESVGRYSKLDKVGNILSIDATSWSCVLDIETGLVWEIKTLDGSYHHSRDRFVWFDNNVRSGVFSGRRESEDVCSFFEESNTSFCNTENLTLKTNKEDLCGFSNWRLPTIHELNSIIVNRGSASVVDEKFFPNTQKGYYWTAEPLAYDDRSTWAIKFRYGAVKNDLEKATAVYVRLVVGELHDDGSP